MSGPIEQHTRLFARVDDNLPVRVRVLDTLEASRLCRHYQVLAGYRDGALPRAERIDAPGPDGVWQEVLTRLDRVERLLTLVAEAVGVGEDQAARWIEGEALTISGGGIGVSLPERLAEGTEVEVELTLPGGPAPTVRATARVASVAPPDAAGLPFGRWRVGLGFTGISSADREALVRHTFRLQRAQLRERKAETP